MRRPVYTGGPLCALSARETVDLLARGEVSPLELIEAALERIAAVEPEVNALPTVCAERARAAALTLEPAEGPGALHGLPIAIKDLTPVSGVHTTFGTKGYADHVPDASDPLVRRLEKKGAIVIAKSNTPEMGAGGNTFNDVFGATRNPWDVSKNAGGSSGGAAAALAAGEVWLAHGSDLAGSLRTPAGYCGVVGLRPSPGRVPGGSELGFGLEAVQGPMARSVADCALFLDAMVGDDGTLPIALDRPVKSFAAAVAEAAPPRCVGFAPDLGGFAPVEPDVREMLERTMQALAQEGTEVEETCPDLPGLDETYLTLRAMLWAAGPGHQPKRVQTHYKQTLAENIAQGWALTPERIYAAERQRTVLFQNMARFFRVHDVLACPVVGLDAKAVELEYPTEVGGRPMRSYVDWLRFSFLAPTTGLPAISVPIGRMASGVPIGMQLIGPPRGEAKLLAVAQVIETLNPDFSPGPIDPVTG